MLTKLECNPNINIKHSNNELKDHFGSHDNILSNRPAGKHSNRCEGCMKTKIAKMTFLVLMMMILCWLPFILLQIVSLMKKDGNVQPLVECALEVVYANSFLNPILYCWQNREFRKAYRRLLFCKKV